MRLDRVARPPELDLQTSPDRNKPVVLKNMPTLVVNVVEPESPGLVFDKFKSKRNSNVRHRVE